MELTTPALLFSAISLLFLAYSGRFLALASLARSLIDHAQAGDINAQAQLANLRLRLELTRWMQGLGGASFFVCVVTMLLLFWGRAAEAKVMFAGALLLLLGSLAVSLVEIHLSVRALSIALSKVER